MDLTPYQGQRIEVEIEGRLCSGRVIRGPSRLLVFLEERGTVANRSDMHRRLGMCRIWKAHELRKAKFKQVLSRGEKQQKKVQEEKPWSETVAMAEGDPGIPPKEWTEGMLAWAEAVHAARRKVDRSRKAMMQALRSAAS